MNLHDPQLRKAAILVASLQPRQAADLLAQLSPDEAAVIRAAVTRLVSIDDSERNRIITEFVDAAPTPSRDPAATNVRSFSAARLASAERRSDRPPGRNAVHDGAASQDAAQPKASAGPSAGFSTGLSTGVSTGLSTGVSTGPSTGPSTGVELDAGLARRLAALGDQKPTADPAAASSASGGDAVADAQTASQGPPFRFLNEADCRQLTRVLLRERPQTIAVVLSYLARERAAEILTELPENVQVDVLRCLADLEDTDAESLRVIERELAVWMESQRKRQACHGAGVAAIAGILEAADANGRTAVLNSLVLRDRQLANRLSRSMNVQPNAIAAALRSDAPAASTTSAAAGDYRRARTAPSIALEFDDLGDLDSRSLKKVFSLAEPELILLALAGASDRLMSRIYTRLPEQVAANLRRHIENLGPTRLRDVEAAQRELSLLASRLAGDGEVTLAPGHVTLTV